MNYEVKINAYDKKDGLLTPFTVQFRATEESQIVEFVNNFLISADKLLHPDVSYMKAAYYSNNKHVETDKITHTDLYGWV